MKAILLLLSAALAQGGERVVSITLPTGMTLAPVVAANTPAFPTASLGLQKNFAALPLSAAASFKINLPVSALGGVKATAHGAVSAAQAAETTLAALGRFEGKVTAAMAAGAVGPGNFGWFDGESEHEGEEAFSRKEEKKAEEKKQAHAERPVLDYLRNRFNEDEALELADEALEFEGGKILTGRQLLALLVTAHAAQTDNPPDLTRVEAALFGVSDTDLRAVAEREGLPPFALQNFYELAFRRGLIYRLADNARGRTYYGVPDLVRSLLKLEAPRPPEEAAKEKARASAFAQGLPNFAEAALDLSEGEELFEFAAQILEAAVKAKVLERGVVPKRFWDRAAALDFDASSLKDALLTLLESSEGTPWFQRSVTLCEQAAADGLLPAAELAEVLRGLR